MNPLTEPSQLVQGMSHKEMLEIMADAGIFCSHDRFARILMDAQRRGFAEMAKRENERDVGVTFEGETK
jgi:hypothetical protein